MPQGVDAGTQANRVRISEKVTTMHLEDGGGMVLAARQKGKDWLICTTSTCAESTGVARVRWRKDGTWTCVRERAARMDVEWSWRRAASERLRFVAFYARIWASPGASINGVIPRRGRVSR